MLSCRELVANADELLVNNLDWRQRLRLRFHLLICVNCRRYLRQLRMLVAALARRGQSTEGTDTQAMLRRLQLEDKSTD